MKGLMNTPWLKYAVMLAVTFGSLSINAQAQDDAEDWIKSRYHQSFRLESLGSYSEAIQALNRVHETYPNGYAVNLRLGWLHYLAGSDEESERYYRQAIKTAPEAAEPRIGLLLPLLAQAKWSDAEVTAFRVLKDDPHNYYANLRLIIALRYQKKYELAVKQAEKLVRLYPADTLFLKELALALTGLGEDARATAVLYDVDTLSPQ